MYALEYFSVSTNTLEVCTLVIFILNIYIFFFINMKNDKI